ncbi:MAG: hypothetical protein EBU97_04745, partial [Rhodobacteraceae bacterium]|nr:hypothetical protein [Paracoccaceae bacterium]
MMLTEEEHLATEALPMAEVRAHLRLNTGFGDDGLQDGLIEGYVRAALATIEGRIGKALFARGFRLELAQWRYPDGQPLPLSPVARIVEVTLRGADGVETALPTSRYRLFADLQRARLVGCGSDLPDIPAGGAAVIRFVAGFGPGWSDVPADLQQAVLLLVAEFHDQRSEEPGRAGGLPVA